MTGNRPEFVARDGYRRRRATDAARLLPVLGAFLFFLPVFWVAGQTRSGYVYLFGIWIGLIAIAAWLSGRLKEPGAQPGDSEPQEPLDGSL